MKVIYRAFFTALLLTQLPFLAAQETAQQDSRAEELRERRRQKLPETTPPKSPGIVKMLLYMEGGGLYERINIRYKDFYPKFGQLSTGSGGALGVRYFKNNIANSGLSVETSGAFSFTGYRMVDFHFGRFNKAAPNFFLGPSVFGAPFEFDDEAPDRMDTFIYLGLRYRYFPREDFYGLGNDSRLEDRTDFLLEDGFSGVTAGHQFSKWLGIGARVGYQKVNTGPGTNDDFPDINELFDDDSAPGLDRQPDFLRIDTAVFLNYRDVPGNPHNGGTIGFGYSRFDDRGGDEFEFNAFAVDARHYFPLGSRQRVLALQLFGVWADAQVGSRVPFYFMRTLGGKETLRGFRQFRFRNARQLHFSAEYRWEAAPAFETALFYDTGKVFPETDRFKFEHLRKSIGIGFRFKRSRRVLFRLDIARSEEGTRVQFQFGPSF
jgi:hypothetical protein